MINKKGKDFATEYWTTIVRQEASNYTKTKYSYGKKGDKNWEYIALAEGWANYRQWKMSKQYLKYNSLTLTNNNKSNSYYYTPLKYKNEICYRYSSLIYELNSIITDSTIELAISNSSSISEFRDNIIKYDSKYKHIIISKFNTYDKLQ